MIRCFVLAVSASLALAGCQVKEEKTGGPSPVRVKVMKVALSEQKTSGRFSGTVEEAAGTPLSFSVMGTVNAVSFRLGDRVVVLTSWGLPDLDRCLELTAQYIAQGG